MTTKWLERAGLLVTSIALVCTLLALLGGQTGRRVLADSQSQDPMVQNAIAKINEGRNAFRFNTFGDQAFWGGQLQLHQAVAQLSPNSALGLGLKVDVEALPASLVLQLRRGLVNLNDPAVTLQLLSLNAVVGVTGYFSSPNTLQSFGIQCALCHSTVDNSLMPGIGRRLDGWANRDLHVGDIIAAAPNLTPVVDLLKIVNPSITKSDVQTILHGWGPGKFDAELFLDGKSFNPATVGLAPKGSTATLIPPAFGLGGVTLHTWTGWGSIPHWNAFVANLEMHGVGRFWDPRLNNAVQFPIAAAQGFGHLPVISPDSDQVTKELAALQYFQLSIPSPQPLPGSFNPLAAKRGDELFSGKAQCNNCHVEPLWTDSGWNAHTPSEICIESFQADRAPDHIYRTSPIGAIFTHMNSGFYHDGRFKTLNDVVDHYNTCLSLGLTQSEESDLIEYLKSLTF